MDDIYAFEALGDPTRRKLFEQLRFGPCSVNELVNKMDVSQPAVSQHLRALKEAHLVQVRKHRQQRIYSLDPAGLVELRAYVESFWNAILEAYQDAAEKSAEEEIANE